MRKRRPPTGAPPGTLAQEATAKPPRVRVYTYSPESFNEREIADLAELAHIRADRDHHHWIDVQGLSDTNSLQRIAETFGIHPLALADAVNTPQRPKANSYDQQLVIVTHMVRPATRHRITVEQLTIVTEGNVVITFQEEEYGDVLDPVRTRLRAPKTTMTTSGSDYLTYAMVSTVVDGYYPVFDAVAEQLDRIEEEVLRRTSRAALASIHAVKRELHHVRRAIWPQREMINSLIRDEPSLLSQSTRLHLRDCYDHTVQLIDMLESYREIAGSLMDAFLSATSNRMNEIVKVLTIISTTFIPLSFVAGVYGMNFEYMPELHWRYGYPIVLGAMFIIGLSLVMTFWRRGWLNDRRNKPRNEVLRNGR